MNNDLRKIPVIMLAAGDSTRMGVPKGLLDYNGQPFLSFQINQLMKIGFADIFIVMGNDKNLYLEKVRNLKNITIAVNAHPEKGFFSSIQCGLQALSLNNLKAVFILPLDVPCPEDEVWNLLSIGLSSFNVNVTIPEFKGKKGHPVLLSEEFVRYLLTLSSSSGLDFEINKQDELQKAKIISVNDKNITLNLNTIEEWEFYKVMK